MSWGEIITDPKFSSQRRKKFSWYARCRAITDPKFSSQRRKKFSRYAKCRAN